MLLTRNCVELLAPAGTWDALVAAVEAGADAVYLGGKHFNMRMHHGDTNFDNEMLKKAVDFTSSARKSFPPCANICSTCRRFAPTRSSCRTSPCLS